MDELHSIANEGQLDKFYWSETRNGNKSESSTIEYIKIRI